MDGILPYAITAFLYIAAAAWRWQASGRTPNADQNTPDGDPGHADRYGVLVPLALHTALLVRDMFAGGNFYLGVGTAISLILWVTMVIYWVGDLFYRLAGLQVLSMPMAAVGLLLSAMLPAQQPIPNAGLLAFRAHVLISMLAYSLFTIASLHVGLMALLERGLHSGSLPGPLRRLPPLLTMEAMLFRIIWAGFILLSLTLVSGSIFSEELFGKAARFNHKTVFGVLSWGIFGARLWGRHVYGWRGRRAVHWTLAGFMCLILAYLGSKFVLEVLLARG